MDWIRSLISPGAENDSLVLWYGTEKFPVTFDKNAIKAKQATLQHLKSYCTSHIGTTKLRYYFAGVELSGDDRALSEFGIKSGSQVLVMEYFQDDARTFFQPSQYSKKSFFDIVQARVEQTENELVPKVNDYLNATPTDPTKNKYMHSCLGELLLQRILDLDAIDIPQDLEDASEARQKRKNAVKLTQSLLDKVDEQFRATCSLE